MSRDVMDIAGAPAEQAVEIDIASIRVEETRIRLVDHDKVRMIAASIAEVGQLDPIAVSGDVDGENSLVLVDGEHRIEAMKLLERPRIKAIVRDQTPEEREKHEIHSTIIRNEPNALNRVRFLDRLGAIFEREHPDAFNGGDRKSLKFKERNQLANLANWSAFDKEAASRTNLSTRSIRDARALASKLDPDVMRVISSQPIANNLAQLKALAERPVEEQRSIGIALAAGAPNVDRAQVAAGLKPDIKTDPEKAALAAFAVAMERLTIKQLQKRADMIVNIIKRKEIAKEKGEENVGKARAAKAKAAKSAKAAKRGGK